MVGVGVGIVNGAQTPALLLKAAQRLFTGLLVVAAVNQDRLVRGGAVNAHFGGAVDIKGVVAHLVQLIHRKFLLLSIG